MFSKLLNRKYARLLVQAVIIFVVIIVLFNLLHSVAFPCQQKRLISDDFNEQNSIPARIKIDNRGGGLVRFVASFDPDDLFRIWSSRKSSSGILLSESIPTVSIRKHNPYLCQNQSHPLQWIIYVLSTPSNFEQRNLLRETWADVSLFKHPISKVVFVMGQSFDISTQEKIEEEFSHHGDLVIGEFEDVQNSFTIKNVLGMKWVSENCMNAKYAFKANDVSFVNIFGMMELSKLRITEPHSIMCPLWMENTMKILRYNCGDYCVAKEDFPDQEFFPQYCAGLGFLAGLEVIKDLYLASLSTPFFSIEDVYITGILPKKLSKPIEFISCLSSFSADINVLSSQYLNASNTIDIFISQVHNTTLFRKLWVSLINRLNPTWFSQLSNQAIERHS